ncbi:MAG TPA: 2Fe-2S iron-sulfur cluster-binding protein [Xanthobacteraceae bacterium]|jgi:carbon-monoxide dehydrogenase small subunit
MIPLTLTVNGRKVAAMVEPRTHLADFLREQCRLTGTHLGCEHGVCGACTVLVDEEPLRSCITFAVSCDGQKVRTIEGFEDDALMLRLREAFTREHALQCGFCTPGMLIAARDIVKRVPGAGESRIRMELAGNLCRCTGYRGIIAAVRSVAETQEPAAERAGLTKGPEAEAAATLEAFVADNGATRLPAAAVLVAPSDPRAAPGKAINRFEESFVARRPPAEVWRMLADVPVVAACLPGAALTEHDARNAKGSMRVKLGPIAAAFAGSASIERDEPAMRGVIRGAGQDQRSGSRTRGEVTYALFPENEGRETRVSIVVEYSLQGMLAQFSRTALVQDLGRRLIAEFAGNLDQRLQADGEGSVPRNASPLNLAQLLWDMLRARLPRLIRGA